MRRRAVQKKTIVSNMENNADASKSEINQIPGPSSNSSAGFSGTFARVPIKQEYPATLTRVPNQQKLLKTFARVPIKEEYPETSATVPIKEEFVDNVNTKEITNYKNQSVDSIENNGQVHVPNSEDVSVDGNVENDVTLDIEEEKEEEEDDSSMEITEPESKPEESDDNVAEIENQGHNKLYCSICKMKKYENHDCFEENQQFSTCLIPNCNILFRSNKSFLVHFRKHLGVGPGTKICTVCFQDKSQLGNVAHVHSNTTYLFKCYTCNIILGNMKLFVKHKLQMHKCTLKTYFGNYLCFHCEKWSLDPMLITNHIKDCRTDQINNLKRKIVVKPKAIQNYKKNLSVNQGLYACLKPTCKQIFRNFNSFKKHYRKHFRVKDQHSFCWKCCTMYPNKDLQIHKAKDDSHSNVAFKCIRCSITFDDIKTFSVHKYTIHDGCYLISKTNKFTCIFCKKRTTIVGFKSHLIRCQLRKLKKIKAVTNEKCNVCGKCCRKAQGISNHLKLHE